MKRSNYKSGKSQPSVSEIFEAEMNMLSIPKLNKKSTVYPPTQNIESPERSISDSSNQSQVFVMEKSLTKIFQMPT